MAFLLLISPHRAHIIQFMCHVYQTLGEIMITVGESTGYNVTILKALFIQYGVFYLLFGKSKRISAEFDP